jgi:hypothetical protein
VLVSAAGTAALRYFAVIAATALWAVSTIVNSSFALTAVGPWLERFIAWRLIAVTDSNQLGELLSFGSGD